MTETKRRLAGLVAAALFVGSYAVAGSFYDIGRVDSLFVFLVLLALLAQRRGRPVAAALLWVLAFQTKQSVLPLAVVLLGAEIAYQKVLKHRYSLRSAAPLITFLVVAGASIVWLNHVTGGWYSFYVFHVAASLGIEWRQVVLYLPTLLLAPFGIAWMLVLAAIFLAGNVRESNPIEKQATLYFGIVSVVLLAGTWFVVAHKGASQNAMMPMYAWVAVLFGIALARLLDWAEQQASQKVKALSTPLILAVALAQLLALVYNPRPFIPPPAAVARTAGFIEQLRSIPGDVYVLNHSYDALLAGKQPHAEGEALGAVLDAKAGDVSAGLRAQLNSAVAAHQYAAIVIDDGDPADTAWKFERSYPLEMSTELRGLRHFTSQPQWILLPQDTDAAVLRGLLRPGSVVGGQARGDVALSGVDVNP
jgi:hypothetical protein